MNTWKSEQMSIGPEDVAQLGVDTTPEGEETVKIVARSRNEFAKKLHLEPNAKKVSVSIKKDPTPETEATRWRDTLTDALVNKKTIPVAGTTVRVDKRKGGIDALEDTLRVAAANGQKIRFTIPEGMLDNLKEQKDLDRLHGILFAYRETLDVRDELKNPIKIVAHEMAARKRKAEAAREEEWARASWTIPQGEPLDNNLLARTRQDFAAAQKPLPAKEPPVRYREENTVEEKPKGWFGRLKNGAAKLARGVAKTFGAL